MRGIVFMAILLLAGCGTTNQNVVHQPEPEPASPPLLKQWGSALRQEFNFFFSDFSEKPS